MNTHQTYIKKSSQKQTSANSVRNTSKKLDIEKVQQPPIKEATQREEDDENAFSNAKVDPNIADFDEDEDDDELINESLFERYDQMFTQYNNFGALFQETAHFIGMLIKKNLILNKDIEDSLTVNE